MIHSLDFYTEMIRFAISKNYLDADLTAEHWGSASF
jgi:hypothetical protein